MPVFPSCPGLFGTFFCPGKPGEHPTERTARAWLIAHRSIRDEGGVTADPVQGRQLYTQLRQDIFLYISFTQPGRQPNAGGATHAQKPTLPAACDRSVLSAL